MKDNIYYLLRDKEVIPSDQQGWLNSGYGWRRVAGSAFKVWKPRKPKVGGYKRPPKRIKVWVSTVFTGLDMNYSPKGGPVTFETMAFHVYGNRLGDDLQQIRTSTYETAEAAHKHACASITRKYRKY